MAVRKQRRVGLVKQLAEVQREAAERIAVEEASRKAAEAKAKALAGVWQIADGSESINFDEFYIDSSIETDEQSRREHRKTAELRISGMTDDQFSSLHEATYRSGYVMFRGLRWRLDQISVDSIRERDFITARPSVTVSLIAIGAR